MPIEYDELMALKNLGQKYAYGDREVMLYACGPEGMLAATARTAMKYRRPCQVSVERIMGCGLGGCYSCVVPMRHEDGGFHPVRSCIAGPVLPADQIVWD